MLEVLHGGDRFGLEVLLQLVLHDARNRIDRVARHGHLFSSGLLCEPLFDLLDWNLPVLGSLRSRGGVGLERTRRRWNHKPSVRQYLTLHATADCLCTLTVTRRSVWYAVRLRRHVLKEALRGGRIRPPLALRAGKLAEVRGRDLDTCWTDLAFLQLWQDSVRIGRGLGEDWELMTYLIHGWLR